MSDDHDSAKPDPKPPAQEDPKAAAPQDQKPAEADNPDTPFALFMSLMRRLPAWLRVPAYVFVLALLVYWAVVPEQKKAEVFTFLGDRPIGTSLFPSVEYETARYNIEIDSNGGATWQLNFTFRRLRNEATKLADVIATSGPKPKFFSDTHELKDTIDRYNPPKLPNLTRHVVALDISNEPIDTPRQANIRYVAPGGFTGQTTEWAGVLALQTTRKAIISIRFTPQKVGSNFKFSTQQWSAPSNEERLPNQKYSFDSAQRILTWEIENPRLNYAYLVAWDW